MAATEKIRVNPSGGSAACAGFSMVEVLVSLVIILLGLLGLLGLQAYAHQAELESYQRAQALILMGDIVDRINTNRGGASCYAITTNASAGTPFLGAAGTGHYSAATCPDSDAKTKATSDLSQIDSALQGAAETLSSSPVGAMLGARACVSYDATTEEFTVAVAWQGLSPTIIPTSNCAKGLYGQETLRRVVSTTLKLAKLKA